MRRPFIIFLVIISLYCWLKDLLNFCLFLLHIDSPYKGIFSALLSLLILSAAGYLAKRKGKLRRFIPNPGEFFQTQRKKEWLLLLFVSSPIILLGLYRGIYPDENFDTMHYELYLQEFDFKDNIANFAAGSMRTYFFPLSERVYALWRHLLGYRLGTIFNTFLLITILVSVYDFIKKFFSSLAPERIFPVALVALLSLFAIFSDYTLLEISSYKTDLIGVPLLLELIHLLFFKENPFPKRIDHIIFFLLASLTVAFKLTYASYVSILIGVYFFQNMKEYPFTKRLAYLPIILLFPAVYLAYASIRTGNPVFPFYNKIFRSSLYPCENFRDLRYILKNGYELFIFPVVTWLDKTRLEEWRLYSFRVLFGYILSLTGIVFFLVRDRKNKNARILKLIFYLSVLTISFDYSCILTTTLYRYGAITEVLYGLIIGLWILYLRERPVITVMLVFLLFFQSYQTFSNFYVKNVNTSWHDYTDLFYDKKKLKANVATILNDRSQIVDSAMILPKVDGFVTMEPFPMDGLAKLLKPNTPIYDIHTSSRIIDSVYRFEKDTVRVKSENKTLVTLTVVGLLPETIRALNNRGYLASELYEIYPRILRVNEPIFLVKIKYVDTSKYIIRYVEQYLREENPAETKYDFSYRSPHMVKAFIRESPYSFGWNFLNGDYEITLNNRKYTTKDRFRNNKIFTISGDSLTVHKTSNIPVLIMIQEIEEKH